MVGSSQTAQKEALGLIELQNIPAGQKVKGFFPISGIHRGGGWVELTFSSSEEEDAGDNEWTDEVWRSQIANASLVKLRTVHTTWFFGSGKVDASHEVAEIHEKIKETRPDLVFINHLKMNNVQKKNLTKAWLTDDGKSVKILDRFELILQIFAARAKSSLAKYELGLAYLNYAKSVVGREGGIPVSYLANLRNFDVTR